MKKRLALVIYRGLPCVVVAVIAVVIWLDWPSKMAVFALTVSGLFAIVFGLLFLWIWAEKTRHYKRQRPKRR